MVCEFLGACIAEIYINFFVIINHVLKIDDLIVWLIPAYQDIKIELEVLGEKQMILQNTAGSSDIMC